MLLGAKPGMGRTTLMRTLADAHDGSVLWASAAAWEMSIRFGVLNQLTNALRHSEETRFGVNDSTAPALGEPVRTPTVGSETGTSIGDPAVSTAGTCDDPTVSEAVSALANLLRRAAGRVLAVVDDAHWADAASLRVLGSVIRHYPEVPLVVVATVAAGDPTVPAANLALLHQLSTSEFHLPPLTAVGVGDFARAHGIELSPSTAEALCRHTGGIVRHIEQLLLEVPREAWERFDPDLPAPAEVVARVRDVLAQCDAATRQLVEAVCVLGPETAMRDAVTLARIDGDPLPALDEAVAAGLLAFGAHGLTEIAPADSMIRAAVLAAMGTAAAVTARRRASELVDDPVRSLGLLVAAAPVPDPDLADRLDELAAERAAEGAWGAAAALLRDAGRLTDDRLTRESRLTRAVDALIGSGDVFGAATMIPEIESLRETPLRNAVLGYLAIVRGRPAEAETQLARAWDLVNAERDPDIAALICQRYVLHALCRCRPQELVDWSDRAIALTEPDTPAAVESAAIRGLGLAYGQMDRARRDYAALTQHIRHGAQVQRIVMARGWLCLIADDTVDARADLESSVPTTYLGGSTRISLWARAWLARVEFLAGDWDDALRTVREATPLLDRTGIAPTGPLLYWTAVAVHAMRGDWDAAREALRRADAGAQDYEIMRIPSYLAHAHWAEARADAAGVLRALRPLTQPWAWGGAEDPGQWPWADMYAHALITDGRHDEADAFLTRHQRLAAELNRQSGRARLAAARGHLLGARGDLEAARAAFAEALGLLEGLSLRYDRARIGFVFGQILRRAGKRREADAEISTARDIFVAIGAQTYVTRCDRELKAGGVHAPRSERGADALTPQEETVAALVASGLSNREVASELFISAKTVQYHLTRIYMKLGVRSRAELAATYRAR